MALQIIHEAWRMLWDYLVKCTRKYSSCMNGARSGYWFIESQRIGARMCKITSNVLHKTNVAGERNRPRIEYSRPVLMVAGDAHMRRWRGGERSANLWRHGCRIMKWTMEEGRDTMFMNLLYGICRDVKLCIIILCQSYCSPLIMSL